MDHFRQSPVPLEAVGLDSEAVASLNIGFPEAGEARGDFVLALVIVHAHLLVFFEGGVVLAEDFGFGSSWTEFEVKVKVKVQGYGVGIGSHCSFAEEKQRERERVSEVDSRWWDGIYQIDSVYMRASRCCVVGFTFWAIVALAPQPMVQWPLGLFFFGKCIGTISAQLRIHLGAVF